MYLYKFRAESVVDVARYFYMFPCDYYQVIPIPPIGSDREVIMGSNKTLEEIRTELEHIPDGHVMVETINHFELYTGERYHEY